MKFRRNNEVGNKFEDDLAIFSHVQKYGSVLLDIMGVEDATRVEVAKNTITGEYGHSKQIFKRLEDGDGYSLEWFPQTTSPREVYIIERVVDTENGSVTIESYMTDYVLPYDNTIKMAPEIFLRMVNSVFGELPIDAEIDATIYSRSGR